MRLLRFQEDDGFELIERPGREISFELVERYGRDIPPYAILSHTWGPDQDEVTFQDLIDGVGKEKKGYQKLEFCGHQAAKDNLEYFWIDTCCIDKSSSTELQEAIYSMYQWYHRADKCYVYLADVFVESRKNAISSQPPWRTAFERSRWFRRGWTLQELLAPKTIEFYSADGQRLGTRTTLLQEVSSSTGISTQALQGAPLSQFSIDERLSWAEHRETKREEDAAYSLLGLFDVQMSLYYGEGRERAMMRLQKKIKKAFLEQTTPQIVKRSTMKITAPIQRDLSPALGDPKQSSTAWLDPSSLISVYWDVLKQFENDDHASGRSPIAPKDAAMLSVGKTPGSKFQDDESGRVSGDRGDPYAADTETIQNAFELLTILEAPPQSDLRLMKRPTGLEDGTKDITKDGTYGKHHRAAIKTINAHKSNPLFLNALRDYKLRSQDRIESWLGVKTFDERYNMAQYYDKQVSSRLEGTCEWIFSHPAYSSWISDDEDEKSRILWICAPPGHGKTVLCAKLIDHLKDLESFSVAYFFASPHAQSGGDPTSIVRYWIVQMTHTNSTILQLVLKHSEDKGRASDSKIWSIFKLMVSETRTLAFVLDGFDEYSRLDDARSEFLKKLKEATAKSDARVLITSREETDIKAVLSPELIQDTEHVMLQCRISNEDVQEDISLFSRHVVDKKLPKKDASLRQGLAEELTEKCSGMFLWIKLQQEQLRSGKNAKQLQSIVKNMPVGLEKTYERNWATIQKHSLEERRRALDILRWATFALRPLTVSEITEALIIDHSEDGATLQIDELPDSIDDDYINGEIIDICGDLVEVRAEKTGDGAGSRTIHLVHLSVREFLLPILLNPINKTDLSLSFGQIPGQENQHEHLATVCLGFLESDDIWQQSNVEEEGEESQHEFAFKSYAANYWSGHMKAAGEDNANLVSLAEKFLSLDNENFQRWRKHIESSNQSETETETDTDGLASPLYYAASFGLSAMMEQIWKNDASQLDKVGGQYGTPLQAACVEDQERAFNNLINWGANPGVKGGEFAYPIHAAIRKGRKNMIKTLIKKGVDHGLQDAMGRSPFYTAAWSGDSEACSWLLEAGADIEGQNQYGWTPINAAAKNGHFEVVKLLQERGANISTANHEGSTPLYIASDSGHLEIVKLLLDKGADIAVRSKNKWTPLSAAADSGHVKVIELLLERGADLEAATKDGWTALTAAADYGHYEVVKLLLEKGANIQSTTNNGWTALAAAADSGHLKTTRLLLEKGADIKVTSEDGWTPLTVAADYGHTEIVKLLLEHGADMTKALDNGKTALHLSAKSGNTEIVKALLNKGADMSCLDNTSSNPLHLAALFGHIEVVKLLLDNGADIAALDKDKDTALHIAAIKGFTEISQLLLDKGSEISLLDEEGDNVLHIAIVKDHIDVLELLLENGADMNAPNIHGNNALHLGVIKGFDPIVKFLLEKGADMATMDRAGDNALHIAILKDHIDTVKVLLEHGADMTVIGSDGFQPLYLAAEKGNTDIAKLLLEKGAEVNHRNVKFGGFAGILAYVGWTDMLRQAHDEYGAKLDVLDFHGRDALYWAARGGNYELFKYVTSTLGHKYQGTNPTDLLNAAVSSGSSDILRDVLKMKLDWQFSDERWSPLHWACRAGNVENINKLVEEGWEAKHITLTNHEGEWSPFSIGMYHGEEATMEGLSASTKTAIGADSETVRIKSTHHKWFYCDSCSHQIYGPRYRCLSCDDFDYCFMCQPFNKELHGDHDWKFFESNE